jgi:hypothetical protein
MAARVPLEAAILRSLNRNRASAEPEPASRCSNCPTFPIGAETDAVHSAEPAFAKDASGVSRRPHPVFSSGSELSQQRDGRWCIVDLVGKHGRVRTAPMPTWVKVATDAWTSATGVADGHFSASETERLRHRRTPRRKGRLADAAALRCRGWRSRNRAPRFETLCRSCAARPGGELEQIQMLLGHASVRCLGSGGIAKHSRLRNHPRSVASAFAARIHADVLRDSPECFSPQPSTGANPSTGTKGLTGGFIGWTPSTGENPPATASNCSFVSSSGMASGFVCSRISFLLLKNLAAFFWPLIQ